MAKYFRFVDDYPTTTAPTRVHDAERSMTDWIREDRQDRQEAVQGRVSTAKRVGAKAITPVVALALLAGIVHEAGGAAEQQEAAAARRTAPIENPLNSQVHHPSPTELER